MKKMLTLISVFLVLATPVLAQVKPEREALTTAINRSFGDFVITDIGFDIATKSMYVTFQLTDGTVTTSEMRIRISNEQFDVIWGKILTDVKPIVKATITDKVK
jgi:hypothetical protein